MIKKSHSEPTTRCELSISDRSGRLESMYVQVPTTEAQVGREIVIGDEVWVITAVDSGDESDLFHRPLLMSA